MLSIKKAFYILSTVPKKQKVLVVCSRNKKRSLTAEKIFKDNPRIDLRSVGTSPSARRKISMSDIHWAEVVLCMENKHKKMIQRLFGRNDLPRVIVLNIEDEYEYMDSELVDILQRDISELL